MSRLLALTGLGKLVSFYRYIYFNGPGVTRWSGVGMLLFIGSIHAYELPRHYEASRYLGVSFAILIVGVLLASLGILRGRAWGWILGSAVSVAALVGYLASRTLGLPGYPEAAGDWDTPAGTVAMILEVLYLGLHFSVVTGMNVAAPGSRDWRD
jgi:hypothetical protein